MDAFGEKVLQVFKEKLSAYKPVVVGVYRSCKDDFSYPEGAIVFDSNCTDYELEGSINEVVEKIAWRLHRAGEIASHEEIFEAMHPDCFAGKNTCGCKVEWADPYFCDTDSDYFGVFPDITQRGVFYICFLRCDFAPEFEYVEAIWKVKDGGIKKIEPEAFLSRQYCLKHQQELVFD